MAQPQGWRDVSIRLTTRLQAAQLRAAHDVELMVPGATRRAGLDDVVRSLLQLPEEDATHFDFLVERKLLRGVGGVQSTCEQLQLSLEKVVDVEYILRIERPRAEEVEQDVEEWVTSIQFCPALHSKDASELLVGMYHGAVRIVEWQESNAVTPTRSSDELSICSGVLACVRWFPDSSRKRILCGGGDGILRVFDQQDAASDDFKCKQCVLTAASADGTAFESVLPLPDGERFAAGCGSGALHVFETSVEANDALSEIRDVKRRRADNGVIVALPSRDFSGHTQAVTSLDWDGRGPHLVSASWDGTLRYWDVEAGQLVQTIPLLDKAAMDVHISSDTGTLAVACVDGALRMVDPRAAGAEGIVSARKNSHRGFASAVRWRPQPSDLYDGHSSAGAPMLASGGHDSSVKVWDLRSAAGALYRSNHAHGQDGKVTCLSWDSPTLLASGGSNGKVRLYSFA